MKKLLAIAVAAALTVPMVAMADTTVYGKGHLSYSDNNAVGSKAIIRSHASRLGFKGSNALDNGLTATHKFELGIDLANGAGLNSSRDTWIGLKGGFGEVRVGKQTVPSDVVDDAADFTTHGAGLNGGGRANRSIAYFKTFGAVGFAAAHVADGTSAVGSSTNDLMVNYAAGPFYAGVGYQKSKGTKAGSKVALAYNGGKFGIGYVHAKMPTIAPAVAVKVNTLSGKYNFGKAYVAAQYSKEKASKITENIFEVGYSLGKGTKVYFSNTSEKNVGVAPSPSTKKTNRIGYVHAF